MTAGPAAGTGSVVTAGVGAAGSGVMSSLQYHVSCPCVHDIGGSCVGTLPIFRLWSRSPTNRVTRSGARRPSNTWWP